MWRSVERLEGRRVGERTLRHLWRRGQSALRPGEGPRHQQRRVVLANALALVHLDDPAELSAHTALAAELGAETLARLQDEVLAPIDPVASRPRTSALVARLARAAWLPVEDGGAADAADRQACARVVTGHTLPPRPGAAVGVAPPAPATREEVLATLHTGGLPAWRRYGAELARQPWAGPGSDWIALLDSRRDGFALACLRAHVAQAQRNAAQDERETVARIVRRLIGESGVSQRELARLVHTSQSRLSTYASGAVVPSAAMLVRISEVTEALRRP